MADTTASLLSAIQTLLKANPAVTALVSDRVYGAAPNNATYPYILLTAQSEPWATQSFSGMRHVVRVQAFDKNEKQGGALAIRAACYDALNRQEASLTITGGDVVLIEHDGMSDCFMEGDGKTWQSILELSVTVQ
jgi:bifunctional N-acetylglucosamine-1-phosphate-uridyltransferase/glucosamine-1-phosphate-acetyltransferase GlmU-like protein